MKLLFRTLAISSLISLVGRGLVLQSLHAEDAIDFNRDVRPLLNAHCVACHGGVKQAADLSFVYEDQALTVITPGDPDNSTLVERVTADDGERMPPAEHGRRLSEREVDVLRRWIQEGRTGESTGRISLPTAAARRRCVRARGLGRQSIRSF